MEGWSALTDQKPEPPTNSHRTSCGLVDVDSDIVLEDQFASRHHAEIRRAEGAYQVCDLNSKNGVAVNGARLPSGGSAWLDDGGEVRFASTSFRFHDPAATVTAPSLRRQCEPALRADIATRQSMSMAIFSTRPQRQAI